VVAPPTPVESRELFKPYRRFIAIGHGCLNRHANTFIRHTTFLKYWVGSWYRAALLDTCVWDGGMNVKWNGGIEFTLMHIIIRIIIIMMMWHHRHCLLTIPPPVRATQQQQQQQEQLVAVPNNELEEGMIEVTMMTIMGIRYPSLEK
jgi:hypothetical protein